MNKEEIRKGLKEVNITGTHLEDLTAILHKYYNPNDYDGPTSSINETRNDYLALVKYMFWRYRQKNKTPSIPTIKQKISYLSKYNVELTEEYVEGLFEKDGLVEEKALEKEQGRENEEDSKDTYSNFIYHSYLAIRTYLKAKDRKDLAAMLPETEEIGKPGENPETEYLTKEEVEQLLKAAEKEETKLIILLGFFSGMRIQEILQTQKGWIRFLKDREDQHGYIQLPAWVTKTGEEQVAYFNQTVEQVLEDKIEEIDQLDVEKPDKVLILNLLEDEVKTGRKTEMVLEEERQEAINLLNEVVEKLKEKDSLKDKHTDSDLNKFKYGDRDLTPHILRHSFIQHVENETDVKTARDQARHRHIKTTLNYLEQDKEKQGKDYGQIKW